jgi:hypothetical protein
MRGTCLGLFAHQCSHASPMLSHNALLLCNLTVQVFPPAVQVLSATQTPHEAQQGSNRIFKFFWPCKLHSTKFSRGQRGVQVPRTNYTWNSAGVKAGVQMSSQTSMFELQRGMHAVLADASETHSVSNALIQMLGERKGDRAVLVPL